MIRTKTICINEASLVAVSALDDIVLHMVKASEIRLNSDFLDWVVDEATPMVEINLGQAFAKPGFAARLHRGDHRIALSQWVRHWVCPQIASRFESLAGRLPEFSVTSPLDVAQVQRAPDAGYSRPLVATRPAFRPPPLAA
ncbi:MAG: hypothetical protein ABIP46_03025 [Polaromonas sp.]